MNSWLLLICMGVLSQLSSGVAYNVTKTEGEVSQYEIVYHRKTYFGALKYCEELGGRLARIPDMERDKAVISWVYTTNDELGARYWIDANDIQEEGVYLRSDGAKQKFANWAKSEPNNKDNEDCIELSENADYAWNDRSCYFPNYFICEFLIYH
ncbi:collectin-11-like [Saccoglossus kowalevskii]|uniref:Collectin-11-like n=1 Tax=Saccoglossus kowalevskii TaxID=10224 RepID=A0ABM0GP66_SACKO|nr:PREDICTED: collectin-11-like [Saccoglossus kowalevskii]